MGSAICCPRRKAFCPFFQEQLLNELGAEKFEELNYPDLPKEHPELIALLKSVAPCNKAFQVIPSALHKKAFMTPDKFAEDQMKVEKFETNFESLLQ